MTVRKFIPSSLFAAVALALTASSGHATLTYNDGDLLLGFVATSGTGSSTDYLVDLGSASNFVSGGSFATGQPVKLSLGNIGADLTSIFGASWTSNANLEWSIVGTQNIAGNNFAAKTIFATEPEVTVGIQSTGPVKPSVAQASTLSGKLNSQGSTYAEGTTNFFGGGLANGDQVQSTNSAVALLQPTSFSDSYASYQPGGPNTTGATSYGYFNPADLNNFGNGTNGSVNDLYTVTSSASSKYDGVFQLDNSGNLYFDSAAAGSISFPISTPEPTSVALLLGGAGFLGFVRRRRC